jgi:hypothetical protein
MRVLAIQIELPDDVPVERLHDANARKHRRTTSVTTSIRASVAACHFRQFWRTPPKLDTQVRIIKHGAGMTVRYRLPRTAQ